MMLSSFESSSPLGSLPSRTLIRAQQLHKTFIVHSQGAHLPVLRGVDLTVESGDCVALTGASGSGKSTFMRSLYGNYRIQSGDIWVRSGDSWVNLPHLLPHELIELRRTTIGYVSQFLRVIPRVSALQVAAEPLLNLGVLPERARAKVEFLFRRLNLPEQLWELSPTTFSGGEKQRVNIARAFVVDYPILLLDEPTSALDAPNREVVIELIEAKKQAGTALIGIFHDRDVRQRVCNRELMFGQHNNASGE